MYGRKSAYFIRVSFLASLLLALLLNTSTQFYTAVYYVPGLLQNNINLVLCLWVILALLDPDPDRGTPLKPDPIRIRIHNTALPVTAKLASCAHAHVQVHQLDIILCALDDYSTLLRERLHTMLQVCSLATKVESPPSRIADPGIRCLFDPGIRDGLKILVRDPDPG